MADELKIWALRDGVDADAVESVANVTLEEVLEETLVRRPEMLESGLHLVGRQTPTDGGPLDLLGVDAGGRLVVYELKREKLTREAVTQCIDYASSLDMMAPEELAAFIAEHSGTGGIDKIEEFEEWYQESFAENELDDLLPPRLVLVGLGVDERAERMARFLSEGGIDISVLTFYGFQHEGGTLLARQVEVERSAAPLTGQRTNQSAAERRLALEKRLAERGYTDLFEDIANTLQALLPNPTQKRGSYGINFGLPSHGGRRRFCHLWVGDGGPQVAWYPTTNWDESVLPTLKSEAAKSGWTALKDDGGYVLDIADTKEWEERRQSLVRFVEAAREAWNATPQTGSGNFHERVWSYVRDVPSGVVVTYGQVAKELGSPEAAQAVGNAMRALPDETDVPWHRVVTAEGHLGAPESLDEQRERLKEEGVNVTDDDRVDLATYQGR